MQESVVVVTRPERHPNRYSRYFLYEHPRMGIHEDGVRFLAQMVAAGKSQNYQRNHAYQLAYWLNYCIARQLDYQCAAFDDLIEFRYALDRHISLQTKAILASQSIAQYLNTVIQFYVHGAQIGWYVVKGKNSEAAVHVTTGKRIFPEPISDASRSCLPRNTHSHTRIEVLQPAEIKRLFNKLESPPAKGGSRNVLIAEWLAYVGLRISELLGQNSDQARSKWKQGLRVGQLLAIDVDPKLPYEHQGIEVVGKYSKRRVVAVPNWLLIKTQEYINTDRKSIAEGNQQSSNLVFLPESSKYRGQGLGVRRYQAIFYKACLEAGLVSYAENAVGDLVAEPAYSPHSLRHTYAVSTYYSLVAQGNVEPWKLIQAQLGHSSLQTTVDTYLGYVSILSGWKIDARRRPPEFE